jgi:hypothetical protein
MRAVAIELQSVRGRVSTTCGPRWKKGWPRCRVDLRRMREMRIAFESMCAAYSTYFEAALAAHRALLSLAAGAR